MSNIISKYLIIYFLIILIFIFLISISYFNFNISNFIWPIPNYYYISSYFGYRISPTNKASSYHSGIDIPAPENTPILSICDGVVTFASWGAGGGYTIVVENTVFKISYCHLSENFIVQKNNFVFKGQIIAYVGPKNIYTINNNPYKDSDGNPTNGATTGCHLHLTIKKDGIAVNPLDYLNTKDNNYISSSISLKSSIHESPNPQVEHIPVHPPAKSSSGFQSKFIKL